MDGIDKGWVKLHRKILDNESMYGKSYDLGIFVVLLLMANRKTGKLTIGRKQLADRFRAKESTIYRSMKRLEKQQQIHIKSNNRFSVITICKYHDYQVQSNNESNNKVTTNEQQSNTLQEVRSKKKNNTTNISKVEKDLLIVVNKALGREFRVLPNGYKKTIGLFSLEEIEKALMNLKNDNWHHDKLPTLKLDYLLRSTTIDKFRIGDSVQKIEREKLKLNLETGKMEAIL